MTTAILQMAVFLSCAFAFAAYLLHIDRKDKQDARQKKIEFPRPPTMRNTNIKVLPCLTFRPLHPFAPLLARSAVGVNIGSVTSPRANSQFRSATTHLRHFQQPPVLKRRQS